MIRIFITIFFLLTYTANRGFAAITLPKFVGNNMVLQRDIQIPIWGWADRGERISVRFLNKSYSTIPDSNGKWMVKIAVAKAGGPYEMILSGKNEIRIQNILIGDVWLCGGQSNMEWTFNAMPSRYNEEIAKSENNNIRFITIAKKVSEYPQKDIQTEGWKICNASDLKNFSAVGYFFGKNIQKEINIPIGLISLNHGHSPAEAWISYEGLKDFEHYQNIFRDYKKNKEQSTAWTKLANQLDQESLSDTILAGTTNIESWSSLNIPGNWSSELGTFDGVVWLKREVNIPDVAEGKDMMLSLGFIDDRDITYFNGKRIGSIDGYEKFRKYTIPGNLVRAGKNIISIRIADFWGGGGISGDPANLRLEVNDGNLSSLGKWKHLLPLEGEWKYKTSKQFKGLENKLEIDRAILEYGYHTPYEYYTPSVLSNGMLAPVIPYGIKGVIWYQGESNIERAFEYRSLLPTLISDWRSRWGLGNLPFLIVQLANCNKTKELPRESDWAELREAQSMALNIPNTGMAVTIDIGQADDIHPWNKEDVGKRLALAGLKVAYGKDIVYSGPVYESMIVEGNKIRIKFKNVGSGLMLKNNDLKEFSIAGEDRKFVWANAKIENENTILIWSDKIIKPLAVRYAWAANPSQANLYNKEDLPASPFRTDTWPGITENFDFIRK